MYRFLISALLVLSAARSLAGDLRVEFRELAPGGKLNVVVFDRAENFPNKPHASAGVPVDGSSAVAVFVDLADGNYAVSAFQDQNANDELDKNLFGVPTERYGFSRNARGKFGPPAFDDTAIAVGKRASDHRPRIALRCGVNRGKYPDVQRARPRRCRIGRACYARARVPYR